MAIGAPPSGAASGPATPPAVVAAAHAAAAAGAAGDAFSVVDYRTAFRRGVEGDPQKPTVPAGEIEAVLEAEQSDLTMLIDRLLVQTTSSTDTTAGHYLGAVANENLVEHAPSANIASGDMNQPLLVPAGVSFVTRWRGASAGAVGIVRVQYRLVRFGGR